MKQRGRHGKAFETMLRDFIENTGQSMGFIANEIKEVSGEPFRKETIQRYLNGTQSMVDTTKDALILHMERYGYEVADVYGSW